MLRRHAIAAVTLVASVAGLRVAQATAAVPTPEPPAPPPKLLAEREPEPDRSRKSDALRDGEPRTVYFEATLVNLHTKELWPVAEGDEALSAERLSHFLRCRVTGHEAAMAEVPVQVARQMAERFETQRIEVVSGYRSSKFNEMLRKKGHQVAQRSRHVMGHALDFRIPGVGAAQLAQAVEEVHEGGIGTYRQSGFVHVDVGPDRRWRGR